MEKRLATKEIHELFVKVTAAEGCRDKAIRYRFSTKRAMKFSKISVEFRRKAWILSRRLYPELKLGLWQYDLVTKEFREGHTDLYV